MKEKDLIYGFRVDRIREIPDLSAVLYEMTHEKTGARLAWMKNNEENKLFSVAFKTIPFDDSGVFHILEHSVLNGSEKYPTKEPFVEMLKGSLNTFLNAMTFPDMTVFPVSSRNDTDFMNLVRVYTDAVFRPLIYTEKRIFEQEGWHVELKNESDGGKFKGVVYNEMKGALSSVHTRIMTEMCRLVYPDNSYRFESGGDPVSIPSLTYEKFIDTHRRFYSPSNAYFYVDGPVDIEKLLSFLDKEYLFASEKQPIPDAIPFQEQIAPVTKTLEYDLSADQELKNNAYVAFGKVLGTYKDLETLYSVSAISDALAGSNESPLKRAILDTGHCLDMSMGLIDGVLQPFGMIELMNTDEEYADELTAVLRDKTREIISQGVDKNALSAAIDRMEFRYREGSEPKGLDRDLNALTAWIHGSDLMTYLDCSKVYERLRELLATDHYEKILWNWIIDEKGTARLVMIPSHDYAAKQTQEEQKNLSRFIDSLDGSELTGLVEENGRLEEWQRSEDSPEAKAALPQLPLSEVSPLPLKYETESDAEGIVSVLRHPAKERGISAVSLYFDVSDMTPDELFLLKTVSSMIGELPTREHTALLLRQKINSVFGDLYFTVDAFAKDGVLDSCRPYFIARGSFLDEKKNDAYTLISEILNETLFLPELIGEQLSQMLEDYKQSIISRGSSYALRRASAAASALNSFNEFTAGFESYQRSKELALSFDREGESVSEKLRELINKICCLSRLTVGVTSFDRIEVKSLLDRFETGEAAPNGEFAFRLTIPEFSGILIPARISYAAQCFTAPVEDLSSFRVLSNIMSLEYLWNEIRVKGGAYGAGASLSALGILGFYSYRDPDAANSFRVFAEAGSFVRSFCHTNEPIDRYIIGTIAKQEPLISDISRGIGADELYFRGVSEEKRIENRRKLLSTSYEDLEKTADHLSLRSCRLVIGAEPTLRSFEKDGIEIVGL